MEETSGRFSRRDFLKTLGAAGAGSLITPLSAFPREETETGTVPTRPFGRSGIPVSILSLGGMFDIPNNLLLLRQALRMGVTYWDTADCYGGGRSEKGIGQYFARYPEDRKKVFLVTKSDDRDADGMTRLLERSLERMNTGTIDLYLIHGIGDIDEVKGDCRKWSEKAKAEGKIRLFGFSTHSNMEECLMEASRLPFIDGIMMTYNFRLMHSERMKAAVEACHRAGVGLTAMKTQGAWSVKLPSRAAEEMIERFVSKGFTEYQAKLKAVWENPVIASICSQMPNMTILAANAAAAMDRTRLAAEDGEALRRYAEATRSAYCAGCTRICEGAIAGAAPVGDLMRYLMYSRGYGDRYEDACRFREIPSELRERLLAIDYAPAAARCPQRLEIARLVREAVEELSARACRPRPERLQAASDEATRGGRKKAGDIR